MDTTVGRTCRHSGLGLLAPAMCTIVKQKASCSNGKPCSMLLINFTSSVSHEAPRSSLNFPAKSGSTSRFQGVSFKIWTGTQQTGILRAERAGDRRS